MRLQLIHNTDSTILFNDTDSGKDYEVSKDCVEYLAMLAIQDTPEDYVVPNDEDVSVRLDWAWYYAGFATVPRWVLDAVDDGQFTQDIENGKLVFRNYDTEEVEFEVDNAIADKDSPEGVNIREID